MTQQDGFDEEALKAQMEAAFSRMGGLPMEAPDDLASGEDDEDGPRLRRGTIVSVHGDDVFVELGPRMQGVLSLGEFESPPMVGESHEFSVLSQRDGLYSLGRKDARARASWRELEPGTVVKAVASGKNTGGLELQVGPLKAFMPFSEVALYRLDDLDPLIGETLDCEVLEVDPKRKRIVLSRRAVLQREQESARKELMAKLSEGSVIQGTVEKIEPFGAFVNLGGGVTGLLHVSNISHQRVNDPSKVLSVGQELMVQIIKIEDGGRRIGLGMKQLLQDPWSSVGMHYRAGQTVVGKVSRIVEFGAFIELEPGVEGLLHRSQIAPERIRSVGDVLKVNDSVTVRIQSVEEEGRKISLSRLNERGALLGSEDDEFDKSDMPQAPSSGTNLGDILRDALEKKNKGNK